MLLNSSLQKDGRDLLILEVLSQVLSAAQDPRIPEVSFCACPVGGRPASGVCGSPLFGPAHLQAGPGSHRH